MFILTKTPSSINYYLKHRLPRNLIDDNITLLTNGIRTYDISYQYNSIKDVSNLTKTQIKVIITVVIIISFIILILAIFRFKNACRNQETDNLQTEIIRNRAAQYSEPSSRRGSVGYYTRRYSRTTSTRFDDQLNIPLPTKRLSIPACDQSSKSTAVVVLSSSPIDTTVTTDVAHHHHYHVTSSCDIKNISNQQISIPLTSSTDIKPVTYKSSSTIGIINQQSRRLILCTVPPHIFCRPDTVRYTLVVSVHDQRHRHPITTRNNIKLSSPTLRKLCLPCITARNHSRHHSNKNKTQKPNQRRIITSENNGVESLQRFELAPRTYDVIPTTSMVHSSSNYSRGNNANHSREQRQHFETSFQNEKAEKKYNETSVVKRETKPTSSEIVESLLLPLSFPTNELTRSNEDDVCNDKTPLLTSELASTIKDSSNHITRKYSLNALLPLVRPSNSHPLCSSLTFTTADNSDVGKDNDIDLKSRRRVSLSSALRRSSFAKQPNTFCSTIDSTTTTKTNSSPPPILPVISDTSNQTLLSTNKSICSKTQPYQKDFMHKIERFRFIDDSASSSTTVTSPVESIEHVNTHPTSTHLITSTLENFDNYIHTKYSNDNDDDDDINSLIDHLNSDILTNGSYSDLNILNNTSSTKTMLHQQTFKPVNKTNFQPITTLSSCQKTEYRQSAPINIPHSITSLPLSKQRNYIETNGYHSHSMDFQSISNKRELIRPIALISTINETSSSSSTATLTSLRSSTSLEFDDNTKPSGVLVDDDFLPMSSPIDEHFWNMTIKNSYNLNNNECFPNVGSSPDIEIKHFDLKQLHTLSETSCDEDDDDDDSTSSSINQSKTFSIQNSKIKVLQKPIVITKSTSPIQKISGEIISDKSSSNPSINSTEQFDINSNKTSTFLNQLNDELLLEKFSLPSQISMPSDFLCDNTLSTNQYSQKISEEDDTQESSPNDASEGDESADNGEIDLVQEFELSQKEEQPKTNNLWTTNNNRDVYIIQEDDLLSDLITTPTLTNRIQPTSIMKIANNKSIDNIEEQQQTLNQLKPKVRFNLDPQYEREREWNKVNKLLGNSVEWTDEFEV